MDNPDTVPWLKKHELVLSTGYILTSTDIYKTIIQSLNNQGCSGLGIKMHRYMDSIPNEMIEQANALNFPIFSIPFSSTMEEIVNLVYYQMFRDEMSESEQWMIYIYPVYQKKQLLGFFICLTGGSHLSRKILYHSHFPSLHMLYGLLKEYIAAYTKEFLRFPLCLKSRFQLLPEHTHIHRLSSHIVFHQ